MALVYHLNAMYLAFILETNDREVISYIYWSTNVLQKGQIFIQKEKPKLKNVCGGNTLPLFIKQEKN